MKKQFSVFFRGRVLKELIRHITQKSDQQRSADIAERHQNRPVNSPGYPVILTVLPWTYDLSSDFNLKRQTNGFRAAYRLILTSETKKENISRFFGVYTNKVKVIANFRLSSGIFDRSDFYF